MILEILLVLIERVVLIDVLHIGSRLVGRVIAFRTRVGIRRVALWVVDALIALQDGSLNPVQIGTTEVMVVVVGRVGPNTVEDRLIHLSLYLGQEVLIAFISLFLFVGQTIVAHILQSPAAAGRCKGIGHRRLGRNLSPLGVLEVLGTIDRHSTFIEFLAIPKHILAHFTQVDIEIAAPIAAVGIIDERIKEPELDVFDVSRLEITGIQLAHHTSPGVARSRQMSLNVQLRIEVIRSALLRIECQIEYRKGRRSTIVAALVPIGEQFIHIDFPDVMVGQLVEVAFNVSRGQRRRTACEKIVNGIPGKQRTVVAAGQRDLVRGLREHRRNAGDDPRRWCAHVNGVLCILKVVQIRRIVLRSVALSGYQVGELSLQRDV